MIPISIQLYTLREQNAVDFPGVLRMLAETGYKGVEFAGLYDYKASEIAAIIEDLGLITSSAHTALPTRENIAELADTYKTLGTTKLISGFGPKEFETVDALNRSIDRFQEAVEVASANGFEFGMHNHNWEFTPYADGSLPYDRILAAIPKLYSELDVFWAAFAGSDPAAFVKKYKSRMPVIHLKDGPLGPEKIMSAVGSGEVDIQAVVKAADPNITKWLIVEIDRCATDMVQAVKDSYAYLVRTGLGAGNKAV
ncbi:MAG: sugar phosphate isomerase/epimerase [Capsulimonadaceae bacterium]|nr:sugar phosphate isomerase/epimerase [Capsulimonadaceae bacterium]